MFRTYDDYCAANEGPEPDTCPCPECDGDSPECPACGGTGERDLRAERARFRRAEALRDAEADRAHYAFVLALVGLTPSDE